MTGYRRWRKKGEEGKREEKKLKMTTNLSVGNNKWTEQCNIMEKHLAYFLKCVFVSCYSCCQFWIVWINTCIWIFISLFTYVLFASFCRPLQYTDWPHRKTDDISLSNSTPLYMTHFLLKLFCPTYHNGWSWWLTQICSQNILWCKKY